MWQGKRNSVILLLVRDHNPLNPYWPGQVRQVPQKTGAACAVEAPPRLHRYRGRHVALALKA